MSSYRELIKNFERIRAYMRDFYVYGFKSREEYDAKSARTYDDERRRLESWLGEHIGFARTAEGKTVFLSIDSRVHTHNPLYKAWKSKSFTDRDITLHFLLLDILHDPAEALSLPAIMERLDGYLSDFPEAALPEEATVRGKLREYTAEGIFLAVRDGRQTLYRRAPDVVVTAGRDADPSVFQNALAYFSETLPCGVVGSYLLDKLEAEEGSISAPPFTFKHHDMTAALDGDVMAVLFAAMQEGRSVIAQNYRRYKGCATPCELLPLRIYISTRSGRRHALAYEPVHKVIKSVRIDYLSELTLGEVYPDFPALRQKLDELEGHMWGVNCKGHAKRVERVEFIIRVPHGEEYVVDRLYRERRSGMVSDLGGGRYRFLTFVYDTSELIPWIRTFICRIEQLNFSNRTIENSFKRDLKYMYQMYGLSAVDTDAATPAPAGASTPTDESEVPV